MHIMRADLVSKLSELGSRRYGPRWMRQLALKAGVEPSTIQRIVKGSQSPTIDTLSKISAKLGVPVLYWFDISAKTMPGEDAWGSLIGEHGDLNDQESTLVSELVFILRKAKPDQIVGMSSHIIKLSRYIRQIRRKTRRD
jgi:transcriptional regulator with XRE-family HTH domain